MNLLQRFNAHIKSNDLFSVKDKLLLAVSGGVDSVVLCELCKQAGYDFAMAHCNFRLRDNESGRDERFVLALGEKYKVRVEVKKFETEKYAADNKISIQEAARKLRYDWFSEIVNGQWSMVNTQPGDNPTPHSPLPTYLLTAHHAGDNNETLLMNFFRGTGLHGLTGIPEKAGYLRRPLLPFSKEELLNFARDHQLEFVEDSSNLSSKYTRNYFRNELIPALEKVYPQVKENLQGNISRFKEIEALYKISVSAIRKKLVREKGKEKHIPVKQLLGYRNRALIYEIIADFGFTEKQIDEVLKLASSESGKYIDSPDSHNRLIKHRHWFIISPVEPAATGIIIIEEKDKQVVFEKGVLKIDVTGNQHPATSNDIATLDAKEISYPLILRKWKTGDYFYPLGMKKKKKIARFLIDQKISKSAKEKVWVVESNKRVLWVVGYRIDERFRITAATRQALLLTLQA